MYAQAEYYCPECTMRQLAHLPEDHLPKCSRGEKRVKVSGQQAAKQILNRLRLRKSRAATSAELRLILNLTIHQVGGGLKLLQAQGTIRYTGGTANRKGLWLLTEGKGRL